jgi:hypothetical protein
MINAIGIGMSKDKLLKFDVNKTVLKGLVCSTN